MGGTRMNEKEFYIVGKKIYQVIDGKLVEVGKKKHTYKDLAKISVVRVEEKNQWKNNQ